MLLLKFHLFLFAELISSFVQSFCQTIDFVNDVMSTYQNTTLGDIFFASKKSNVVLVSELFSQSVSLLQFAKHLATKATSNGDLTKASNKILKNLQGDAFLNSKTKKIVLSVSLRKQIEIIALKFIFSPLLKIGKKQAKC